MRSFIEKLSPVIVFFFLFLLFLFFFIVWLAAFFFPFHTGSLNADDASHLRVFLFSYVIGCIGRHFLFFVLFLVGWLVASMHDDCNELLLPKKRKLLGLVNCSSELLLLRLQKDGIGSASIECARVQERILPCLKPAIIYTQQLRWFANSPKPTNARYYCWNFNSSPLISFLLSSLLQIIKIIVMIKKSDGCYFSPAHLKELKSLLVSFIALFRLVCLSDLNLIHFSVIFYSIYFYSPLFFLKKKHILTCFQSRDALLMDLSARISKLLLAAEKVRAGNRWGGSVWGLKRASEVWRTRVVPEGASGGKSGRQSARGSGDCAAGGLVTGWYVTL
ncbi:hypothetical protein VP01_1211g2 [Puccinia sorghi]|uniref:Uncharacterized protein n=1 Tax=Puccinia sorghi TaxID=27349 RepID=A0A0L6VRR9_9BASI|nr:hypothetical protein VP01_1211g2 [Puccinia sorghi]